jgi:hypothetical protein
MRERQLPSFDVCGVKRECFEVFEVFEVFGDCSYMADKASEGWFNCLVDESELLLVETIGILRDTEVKISDLRPSTPVLKLQVHLNKN